MYPSPKLQQLFYLTNERLWAYQWSAGQLSSGRPFNAERNGFEDFAGYLDGKQAQPAFLLVDLVEEDFQRHSLPHVGGKAGRNLVARKLGQLYRDTPYRYAKVQQREEEGRRDDSVLFSGLTNPAAVAPWVQVMEQYQIPLAGIYSLATLSADILGKLDLADEEMPEAGMPAHLLLVTRQTGGLRQSYFQDGHLRFSRLTPSIDTAAVAASIVAETEKTHQFLISSRMMARNDQLLAAVVNTDELLARVQVLADEGAELRYRLIPLEQLAWRLGLDLGRDPTLAQQVMLAYLAKAQPYSHYVLGKEARFFQLWQARRVLYGASVVVLAGSFLWMLGNLWASYAASEHAAQSRAEMARSEARSRASARNLPPTVTKPANMKAAVLIDHLLASQGPMPAPLLGLVSRALDAVPLIQLNRLDWQVRLPAAGTAPASAPGGAAIASPAGGAAQDGGKLVQPMSSLLVGVPSAPQQTLLIEAEVTVPPGEDRATLENMQRFAQELARTPRLQVAIQQPPLDVRPSVKLSGKAGTAAAQQAARPTFILSLVWNP